jgi:ribose 5-phosphate isomerase RpiB
MSGDGSLVEKVSAQSNADAGIIVEGSVIESSAIGNCSTGILAVIVRDSESASKV